MINIAFTYSSIEDYSYFTLRHEATESRPVTSLFGISCTRQMDAAELIKRPPDVTRSTVQKAVVVICDTPQYFTSLREKLGFVTKAWFAQKDFSDLELLKDFQKSLDRTFRDQDDEKDHFFGLSLREIIHQFKWQTLVLFKCLLLQPKVSMRANVKIYERTDNYRCSSLGHIASDYACSNSH